jgi:TM2 domain-containing membrane protein YozV
MLTPVSNGETPAGPPGPDEPTMPYGASPQPYASPQPPYGAPASWSGPHHAPGWYPSGPYQLPATAPYGVHPVSGTPYSDKSKTTAGLLQLLLPFVGICGVGRLYAGHLGIGLVQLLGMFLGFLLFVVLVGFLVVPAIWLWSVIDGIVILAGDSTDAQGRPLRG